MRVFDIGLAVRADALFLSGHPFALIERLGFWL